MDCIFCKILSGEISTKFVYEDDIIAVFNDINPQAPIHLLIIPKEHITSIADITPSNIDVISHIFKLIPKIAKEQGLTNGFRLITNSGKDSGQLVPHLHFHMLGKKLLNPYFDA